MALSRTRAPASSITSIAYREGIGRDVLIDSATAAAKASS